MLYLYVWKLSELQTECPCSSANPLEESPPFLASPTASACSEGHAQSCEAKISQHIMLRHRVVMVATVQITSLVPAKRAAKG